MLDLSQLHVQKLADKAKLIKNFEANCACCGAKLPKFPVRSITCPSCSKKSYVENNPVYNKKVLVSEEEKVTLKELDEANKKIYKAIGLTLDEKPRPSQILCKYGDRCNYPLNSHGLVSAQNPGVKEDPERFTKRPMQEYLDDESAPKF